MKTAVSCAIVENYQVQVRTDRHSWIADEPPRFGGDGLGPNPFELLLAGLGTCTTITVCHDAAEARLPVEKITVDVAGQWVGSGDAEAYHVKVILRVRGPLDDAGLARLKSAADRCPVKQLLAPGIHIHSEVRRV